MSQRMSVIMIDTENKIEDWSHVRGCQARHPIWNKALQCSQSGQARIFPSCSGLPWRPSSCSCRLSLRYVALHTIVEVQSSTSLLTLQAILEVFLLCLAGYILARRGVLDKRTQKVSQQYFYLSLILTISLHNIQQINRLNVSLFTPSLLFSKVAFSLSPGEL